MEPHLLTSAPRPVGRPVNLEHQQRRRADILQAAIKVFAETGFTDTDVRQIALVAKVGKGTVYRHFSSKEDLFLAAVDWGVRQLNTAVMNAAQHANSDLQRIALAIGAYLSFFDEHLELVELLIQERAHFRSRSQSTYFAHRNANLEPWRALFQDLIDRKVLRPVPIDEALDVVSDLLYGTLFTHYFGGRRTSLASQTHSILDIVFHGLLEPPGNRHVD